MASMDEGFMPPVPEVDATQGRRAGINAAAWLMRQHGGDTPEMREDLATMLDVLGLNGRPIRVNYGVNGSAAGSDRRPRDSNECGIDIRRETGLSSVTE